MLIRQGSKVYNVYIRYILELEIGVTLIYMHLNILCSNWLDIMEEGYNHYTLIFQWLGI